MRSQIRRDLLCLGCRITSRLELIYCLTLKATRHAVMNNCARIAPTMAAAPIFAVCCMCGALCPDKFTGDARGWDWFTGYLDETVHFCPHCRSIHAGVYAHLRRLSLAQPVSPAYRHRLRDVLKTTLPDAANM
ncbi:hypothetical protein G3A43_43240 [Paraburkholderia aspalathi]|nr:hypothetical protein [Paraburkholderia aspalathi]MBK3786989.1 hypothetical protein [Paraburkholderia aspalathi]